MRKGISAIIATILMLIIIIALAGSAYMFISGVFTARVAQVLELIDFYNGEILIRNSGTAVVKIESIKVYVDDNPTPFYLESDIEPGAVGSLKILGSGWSGTHHVRVVGPTNVISFIGNFGDPAVLANKNYHAGKISYILGLHRLYIVAQTPNVDFKVYKISQDGSETPIRAGTLTNAGDIDWFSVDSRQFYKIISSGPVIVETTEGCTPCGCYCHDELTSSYGSDMYIYVQASTTPIYGRMMIWSFNDGNQIEIRDESGSTQDDNFDISLNKGQRWDSNRIFDEEISGGYNGGEVIHLVSKYPVAVTWGNWFDEHRGNVIGEGSKKFYFGVWGNEPYYGFLITQDSTYIQVWESGSKVVDSTYNSGYLYDKNYQGDVHILADKPIQVWYEDRGWTGTTEVYAADNPYGVGKDYWLYTGSQNYVYILSLLDNNHVEISGDYGGSYDLHGHEWVVVNVGNYKKIHITSTSTIVVYLLDDGASENIHSAIPLFR